MSGSVVGRVADSSMTTTHTNVASPNRRTAAAAALLLGLGSIAGVAACSDEDGDGGETDEEIQDVEDEVDEVTDDVEDEVDEEVDAQNEGDNQG
jgi:hypothetical protein